MRLIRFSTILAVLMLSGCGFSSDDGIREWMAEERNQTRPHVAPLPAPKQFKPEAYNSFSATEPFSNQKLTQALKRDASQAAANGGLVAPELARRKEPLEAFPLDAIEFVGSIVKSGQNIAILKVDKLLYQVRSGSYLGQNYGRVVKVNETEVTLREIVQDAVGEWIERVATLQLQEGTKK